MNISIIKGFPKDSEIKGLAVMVDVFRASSTIISLSMLNFKEIIVKEHIENNYIDNKNNMYLISDKEGDKNYDNSPVSILSIKNTENKSMIISSKNGTKIKKILEKADSLIFASFLNIEFVAKYIKQYNPENVTIIAIGNISIPEETLEDNLCAETLFNILTNKKINYLRLNKILLNRVKDIKKDRKSPQGINVDIDRLFSISYNIFNVIPQAIKIKSEKIIIKKNFV